MAIVGAWLLDDDSVHVELLAADYCDPLNALAWVTERAGRRTPVDRGRSPSGGVADSRPASLEVQGGDDVGSRHGEKPAAGSSTMRWPACLSHKDQPQLNAAVEGARRRPIGQAGAYAWDRRDGAVFVAPLVAATLARFGAVTAGRRRTGRSVLSVSMEVNPEKPRTVAGFGLSRSYRLNAVRSLGAH